MFKIIDPLKINDEKIIIAQSTLTDGNMTYAHGNIKQTIAHRRNFLNRLGLELENMIAAGLTHGTKCEIVGFKDKGKGAFTLENATHKTDALVTADNNIILAVTTADCLPIFVWDDEHSVIGTAHAGWKGLAEGIIKSLLDSINKVFAISPKKMFINIGIGIGRCCYTVNIERLKLFSHLHFCDIHHREGEIIHLDLKTIARLLLQKEGIPPQNIEIEPQCSFCDGNYPSYRRDGGNFIADLAIIVKKQKNFLSHNL
jgi:YfiH family protein